MFNWRKKEQTKESPRSLDDLRKQLRILDESKMRELKGGQGTKPTPPALLSCGGWLPQ